MHKISEYARWAWTQTEQSLNQMSLPWQRKTLTSSFKITIVTGDKRGAGTDANIYIVLKDPSGRSSATIRPNKILHNDHERGASTSVDLKQSVLSELGPNPKFSSIEIWRDDHGAFSLISDTLNRYLLGGEDKDASHWYLDRIEVDLLSDGGCEGSGVPTTWHFPVHRWINSGVRYVFPLYDCCLPQDDRRIQFRYDELERKKKKYIYAEKVQGGPIQVSELPEDENFSECFFWTFLKKKAKLMVSTRLLKCKPQDTWDSLDDFKDLFGLGLQLPKSVDVWREDFWFGLKRLQGANPALIELCTQIPQKLNIEADTIDSRLLEGLSLSDAVEQRKIFKTDLSILEDLSCKDGKEVASPIALFYLKSSGDLLPICIQLKQTKDDPVFTPNDNPSLWLLAKLFYGNAEAQLHQSLTHLGFTHLLMEGVVAATHRCLSPSHPLFRLMAPHFLYLIAINKRGEEKLINPGGWVDSTMTQGTDGMFKLMGRGFQRWNFSKLDPLREIASRGVLDEKILPYYPYRDDIIEVYPVIRRYVEKVVNRWYNDGGNGEENVRLDCELQEWRKEMSTEAPNGLGMKAIEGSDQEGFIRVSEVVNTISCIIATCSLGHSAANAQQYEQYAFLPNYPPILETDPPMTKPNLTESDLISYMPSLHVAMDTMVITKLLSEPITQKLGDFEVQYLYHPQDVRAADEFRQELALASAEIQRRNEGRKYKYEDLDPKNVPNSISI